MPAQRPPPGLPPGRPYKTLGDAGREGMIVQVWCAGCRKRINFLASDLAKIVGHMHYAHEPPFQCSRCRTDEYMATALRMPVPGDYGDLVIRRPGEMRLTWHMVRLGDET